MSRRKSERNEFTDRQAVEEFVRVLRRIAQHPTHCIEDFLPKLASQEMNIAIREDHSGPTPSRKVSIRRPYVDEIVIESLALRTRRLESSDDSVYYPRVMNRLKALINNRGEGTTKFNPMIDRCKKEWTRIQSEPPIIYMSADLRQGTEEQATSLELVEAWRNGHMFHGDFAKRDREDVMSYNDIVLESTHHVARVAVLAIGTLNLLRQLFQHGALPIDGSCFEEQVTFDPTVGGMSGKATLEQVGPRVEVPEKE